MKRSKQPMGEQQIETEAEDHAQETVYAVTHSGKEMHPNQKEKHRKNSRKHKPAPPWQVD